MTLPDYPTLFWVTAVFAMILIGISKAGFGGGVGAVATPLLALTISVTDAAIYLLPQERPRQLFVGTIVIFFLTPNLVKLIPYSALSCCVWAT